MAGVALFEKVVAIEEAQLLMRWCKRDGARSRWSISTSISACFSLPACAWRWRRRWSASCEGLMASISATSNATNSAVSTAPQWGQAGAEEASAAERPDSALA
eukprot:6190571-Pleurochrysis_carterae.AAC.5